MSEMLTIKETLTPKEQAVKNFKAMLGSIDNVGPKTGIRTVLGMFTIRGFDGKTLKEAFEGIENIREDAQFVGNKDDGRLERLAWLISNNNGEAGRNLTVGEATAIFEEEGIKYNPTW